MSKDTLLFIQYFNEGMEYYEKGDQKTTKIYIEKLVEISFRNNWEDSWVNFMQALASFELYLGNFKGSRILYDSLMKMSDEGKIIDDHNKFKIYDIYSGILSQEGDIGYSEVVMQKAEALISKVPVKLQNSTKQRHENGKGLNYLKYGDYRRAKISFLNSIKLLHLAFEDGVYAESSDYEFTKVILYKNVANNDIMAGNLDIAKIYLDSALTTFEGLKSDPYYANSPMQAALNNTIGEYYLMLGDYNLAQKYMQERVIEIEKYKDRVNLQMNIEARQNLAKLFFQRGNYDSARVNFDISLRKLNDLKVSESSKLKYLSPIIHFYQVIGENKKGDDLLSKVDFDLDPIQLYFSGAGEEIVAIYALKANSLANKELQYKGKSEYDFLDFNRKAISLSSQLSKINGVGLESNLKQPTRLAIDCYVENLRKIHLQNPSNTDALKEAIYVINFAKNQRFNEQRINSSLWTNSQDQRLFSQEKQLKRKLGELERKYEETNDKGVLDSLIIVFNELEGLKNSFYEQQSIPYDWSKSNQFVNYFESQKPKHDQQELHYFYSDKHLHVFVRTGRDQKWTWNSIDEPNLEKTFIDALNAFQNYSHKDWESQSRRLYEILLQDYINQDIKRIVIFPYGNIGLVPFAALLDRNGKYLIENHAVSLNNSTKINQAKWNITPASNEILAFAPYFESFEQDIQRNLYGSLKGTKQEIAGISNFFNLSLFEGNNATKLNFLKECKKSRLIHLATHAFAESNVLFSKIIFSGSEMENEHSLFGYEIPEIDLNVDMLILSACQTGYGRFELGEGVSSLAKLFENSGARSLVYTLWKVDDYASAELISKFYKYLDTGMDKDLAIQAAQIEYLRENTGKKDLPYYWAGFVLSGDLTPVKSKFSMYYVFALALLTVFIFWIFRRYIFRSKNVANS
ncbi:CHAT domain-containing protein [Belliella kenyensis]|uniref:CHAT domain-containing protein n=1 Tax=Belliella kenyensis TaxID=1472724 RepID=A0ABV8ELI4_9BACT|nr:CHAT domain-containing protein [Belliella kenyensis]MCH7400742.1 CHAT domain-containing protein [Belliella kenyensis]MDN3601971.1 CHAT domain-containing protein [Belliella kenyensis]